MSIQCECPEDSNPAILGKAMEMFDGQSSDPKAKAGTPTPAYEFRNGATGEDTDNDGAKEIDCAYLVFSAINATLPPDCPPVRRMTSHYFRGQKGAGWLKQHAREVVRNMWFCKVDPEDAGQGDIVVFLQPGDEYGHMGIVKGVKSALDSRNPMSPKPAKG